MNIALETSLISAGTSFVVLLLGQILWPMIKDWRVKKSEAQYLAIRVVCVLDKFVEDCASTAIDHGDEDQDGETVPQVHAPAPPNYPADVNWKSINNALMYRLLSLPALTERGANLVQGATEHAFPPDNRQFFEARTESYATLGLQAFALAKELRDTYEIGPPQFLEWDPVSCMEEEVRKLVTLYEQRTKKYKEFKKFAPQILPIDGASSQIVPSGSTK
jgi:hypothetical protein